MVAEKNVTYDGQSYKEGEEIWDLGSFIATDVEGNVRNYKGLSKDVAKLPHYVATGSTAYCIDTGDLYMYEQDSGIWYQQ